MVTVHGTPNVTIPLLSFVWRGISLRSNADDDKTEWMFWSLRLDGHSAA